MDGKTQVIEKWVVEGCFFQAVDYTDLDYSDSSQVLVTCTIRYDHAHQEELSGYEAGEGVATGGAGIIG